MGHFSPFLNRREFFGAEQKCVKSEAYQCVCGAPGLQLSETETLVESFTDREIQLLIV